MGGTNDRVDYLDGLRGWAAVAVVVYHSTWELFGAGHPAVRVTWPGPLNDGGLAVNVFFVLSGLVLTLYCARDPSGHALRRMAAGRYVRLALPMLLATSLGYGMLSLGLMANRDVAAVLPDPWVYNALAEQTPSVFSWVKFALYGVFRYRDGTVGYNPFLWTMPVELFGSWILFGILGLFGRKRFMRLTALCCAVLISRHTDDTYVPFFYGALLADLPLARLVGRRWAAEGAAWTLVGAAWFGSAAYRGAAAGEMAALLVTAVVISPAMQRPLRAGLSRWLGRISFPLYLVHCYVLFGPACWATLKLSDAGIPMPAIILLVAPGTIAASLALASLMQPIDAAGRLAARWVGVIATDPIGNPATAALLRHPLLALRRQAGAAGRA